MANQRNAGPGEGRLQFLYIWQRCNRYRNTISCPMLKRCWKSGEYSEKSNRNEWRLGKHALWWKAASSSAKGRWSDDLIRICTTEREMEIGTRGPIRLAKIQPEPVAKAETKQIQTRSNVRTFLTARIVLGNNLLPAFIDSPSLNILKSNMIFL